MEFRVKAVAPVRPVLSITIELTSEERECLRAWVCEWQQYQEGSTKDNFKQNLLKSLRYQGC